MEIEREYALETCIPFPFTWSTIEFNPFATWFTGNVVRVVVRVRESEEARVLCESSWCRKLLERVLREYDLGTVIRVKLCGRVLFEFEEIGAIIHSTVKTLSEFMEVEYHECLRDVLVCAEHRRAYVIGSLALSMEEGCSHVCKYGRKPVPVDVTGYLKPEILCKHEFLQRRYCWPIEIENGFRHTISWISAYGLRRFCDGEVEWEWFRRWYEVVSVYEGVKRVAEDNVFYLDDFSCCECVRMAEVSVRGGPA